MGCWFTFKNRFNFEIILQVSRAVICARYVPATVTVKPGTVVIADSFALAGDPTRNLISIPLADSVLVPWCILVTWLIYFSQVHSCLTQVHLKLQCSTV